MRRVLLLAASAALLWAVLVVMTGGFTFTVWGTRVSSRNPVNPLVIALVSGVLWVLAARPARRAVLADDLRRYAAPGLATALAVIVVVIGLTRGALVAGGSDSYGYLSQADAFAAGTIRFEEPLIREFAGRIDREAFVPLGYHAAGERGTLVPTYAPGLPLLMSVAQRVAGRDAAFLVVPLLAGVAILATYVMGLRAAGPMAGALAAILLATSPSFLFQLVAAPMTDVPVTAWWALALALLLVESRTGAAAAGVAAGIAVLTRPNLVPCALVPLVMLLSAAVRERATSSRALQRAVWFALGVVPGCAAVAVLFTSWYGSPLMSGYGRPVDVLTLQNVGPNLMRYPAWVFDSESPVVLAAFAAPWLVTRLTGGQASRSGMRPVLISWLCFVLAVLAMYLPYETFEAWWFVRFMLPAFPPLLVLTSVAIVAAAWRLPVHARMAVPIVIGAVVAWHGLDYARDRDVLGARSERKYAVAGEYVARRLPAKAVVLASQHSGSVRYYAGRPTVRFDRLAPGQLDSTLTTLAAGGYRPYILLEPWEVPMFQKRYAGFSALAALDWSPAAILRESNVRIYDPADRAAFLAGRPPLTEMVP